MATKRAKKKAAKPLVGFCDLTDAQYHADPCPVPSLSASIAKVLIDRTPRHAWIQHPRLNPDYEHEDAEKFDIGHAAHAALLQGLNRVHTIDAKDWRKDETKAERDAARAAGRIPILKARAEDLLNMVQVATAAIAACEDLSGLTLADGKAEQTVIWREGPTWCRSKLDWLANDRSLILDYKTTSGSAHPSDWTRSGLEGLGGDVQAAFYTRGIKTCAPDADPKFVFLVQEIDAPYACSFVGVPPAWLDLGMRKVDDALALWSMCMESNNWPAYPSRICWADLPAWAEARYMERIPAGVGMEIDPLQSKHGMQA